jgi:hypothetical protein
MRRLQTILAVLGLAACVNDYPLNTKDSGGTTLQERLGLADAEVARILEFLNDCETSFGLLDQAVPLPSDAAANLITHRDGADAACGSADDDPYDDLEEVDDVPRVGDATVRSLWEFIKNGGDPDYDGGGTWEGVTFTGHEVEVVLEIANEATEGQLDDDVGLIAQAAVNIVAYRPHATMEHLAATPQVGEATLRALKDYVPSW